MLKICKIILKQNSFLHTTRLKLVSKNYYDILQISKNANPAEVKKAYYKLAKKHHPDRNPKDPRAAAVFLNISEAYEVLSDEQKRLDYDKIASSTQSYEHDLHDTNEKSKTKSTWIYNLEKDPLELFKEVFGDLKSNFHQAASEDRTAFGQDNKIPRTIVTLSIREAAEGTTRGVKFPTLHEHDFKNQEVLVTIPAGIEDGQTVRLRIGGLIEALVQVKVETPEHFQRQGCHIFSEEWVDIWEAALGTIVSFKGIHQDQIHVQLPKGLKSHSVLKLPNLGLKRYDHPGQFGDHFVTIKIKSIKAEDSLTENVSN